MKRLAKKMLQLALPLSLITVSVDAAVAPPRLWEVTGKNEQGVTGKFYILAVTHNGLEVEYDAYFRNKVIPAFDQSTIFLFEGASLAASQVSECPTRLDKTKQNAEILRLGRDRVSAAYLRRLNSGEQPTGLSEEIQAAVRESRKIFAKSVTDGLSEYGLILAMKENFQAIKAKTNKTTEKSIVNYLAKRRTNVEMQSIDSPSDMLAAYCGMGKERAQEFERQISAWDPATGLDMPVQLADRSNNDFVESLQKNKLAAAFLEGDSSESWKSYVCDRNEKWAKRIIRDLSDGKRFYALGMAHLLPQAPDRYQCDDLLTMLKKIGMDVAIVR